MLANGGLKSPIRHAGCMVQYSFEAPDDLWYEWADSIPRSTSLDEALVELIRDDLRSNDE